MATEVAFRAGAIGGIGEPDIARHVGLCGAEQRHFERDIGAEDFADPSRVDHRFHLHHRGHGLHEGIDHRYSARLMPCVDHGFCVGEILRKWNAVIDMLGRAERRHHHGKAQRRPCPAIDDIDFGVGRHFAKVMKRARDAEV